jgi:hypothetical protein
VGIPNLLHALLREIHECTIAPKAGPTGVDRAAAALLKVGRLQIHSFIAELLAAPVLEQVHRR